MSTNAKTRGGRLVRMEIDGVVPLCSVMEELAGSAFLDARHYISLDVRTTDTLTVRDAKRGTQTTAYALHPLSTSSYFPSLSTSSSSD